ncbi:MAG: DEAD/DEAH box helicase family protein [Treponema sp.]|nr:DEAD/DEAH box helicase family protein [Spirochaetia bacterium]MDD7533369.1 DEAD/DEAH box helicase family protein [Treponema sp.]MDY5758838.1 DEAD/DEAH box helicase family protein [Treponema sp.]MDY5818742.1 DEAD/DEAH box helicase family protein [Treponema sp.]
MELKSYQARTIQELKEFISFTKTSKNAAEAYENYWKSKGIIPASDANIKPYNDSVKNAPHVCLKVPTAGGKTFIACSSLKAIFDEYSAIQRKAVVWLVPSDSILEQTKAALKNPNHPYRQRINVDFANRVEVYEKSELLAGQGFSPTTVRENLSIFVLSFDSLRTSKKEGRKVYQDNGALMSFSNDIGAESTDEDITLMKVISSLYPVVIVDESHNAVSELSIEMLNVLNPSFVLDLTATPRESSNIISFVTAQELKNENMVKLPVIIQNNSKIEGVIGNALHLRRVLELKAKECEKNYGTPYIRPIVLFQAQPKSGEEATTFEKLKQILISAGCKEEEIAIKTADINELKNVNLMSNRCKIKYIITVNALKEGWDCPFAYILASVANRSADVDVTQILGRILRQPYVQHLPDENLNTSYVLTNSSDFFKTVERIAYTLNQNHFTGKDFRAYEENEKIIETPAAAPEQSELELTQQTVDSKITDTTNTQGSDDLNNADTSLIGFYDDSSFDDAATAQSTVTGYEDSIPDSTKSILEQAQNAASKATQEKEENKGQKIEVPELQSQLKKNQYAMKEEFKEFASSLKIPQFSLPVNLPPQFNFDNIELENSGTKFHKSYLLHGFELSREDTKINFSADIEMYEIDSSENQYQQMTFKLITGTELENIKKIICDKNQKKEARIEIAKSQVMEIMGSKYPIDDKELAAYIEHILKNFTEEEFEKFASNILLYSKTISDKIDELSDAYCEPKFYNDIEKDKIQLNYWYELPEIFTIPNPTTLSIQKSLYEKEGEMNDFEKLVISEATALPNVEWWHRNPSRGEGFEINGVTNHYPDFIIKTTSGKIIMLETKGDHLIATKKIKLGNIWAQNAGKQFKYFLVYDKLQVEGSKTKEQFLDLMKDL